jgi:hypothetical protein
MSLLSILMRNCQGRVSARDQQDLDEKFGVRT